MSILTALYTLFIYPLELLFEVVFALSEKNISNPMLSIVVLSLVVNFLALPLYKRADYLQEQERLKQEKMAPWVNHIKKTFKGDERFMMLQTYYRQEGYKQISVFKSSIPLLLQVPFFIAAYNFLTNLNYINGVAFGPISDLSKPDALLAGINVLPILMTVINIAASYIYAKGQPVKAQLQMYVIALVFLVLLYNSPAGLVFYWLLNNIFSLIKNIVMKFVKLPKIKVPTLLKESSSDNLIFWIGGINLAVLTGLTIPGATISSSPLEFMLLSAYVNPLLLILRSFIIALGVFVIWSGIFYLLMSRSSKTLFSVVVVILNYWALWDYFVVDRPNAKISSVYTYQYDPHSTTLECYKNFLVMVLLVALIAVIFKNRRKICVYMLIIPTIALVIMSSSYISKITNVIGDEYFLGQGYRQEVSFELSTEGNNVVVIMLDRAIGEYFGYAVDTYPELKNDFDGFVYYSNTISYGQNTLFAAPALYGGYEYSAEQLNMDKSRSLEDKINESLLVMPVSFKNAGYDTTVINPPYAGYAWIPNLEMYEPFGINAYVPADFYSKDIAGYDVNASGIIDRQERNLFCYSMTKVLPAFMLDLAYDDGNYNSLGYGGSNKYNGNIYYSAYIDAFSELHNIINMTKITNDGGDNFVCFTNNTTHEALLSVDERYLDGIYKDGQPLDLDSEFKIAHWQINFNSYEALVKWFNYLKEQGVYDNTRIIIVSDHGYSLYQEPTMIKENDLDLLGYNPLLLVKDFNSTGFQINDDLITNASVPYFATVGMEGINTNPFTLQKFCIEELNDGVTIIESPFLNPTDNTGNTFYKGTWYKVYGDNIYDMQVEKIEAP